jgi:hypothetical protein
MNKIIIGAAIVLASFGAHANNSAYCYNINDSAQKNYCLAQVKRQSSYCYNINDSNTKNMCLAQSKNQRSYCYNISNSGLKNQCLAQTR